MKNLMISLRINIKRLSGLLGWLFVSASFASHVSTNLSVPFQNVALNPHNTINANYSFGTNAIIFCYENNLQTVGYVAWTYKGKIATSTLSVSLITNGNYQGSFADPSGIITITNTTGTALIVNCEYAF